MKTDSGTRKSITGKLAAATLLIFILTLGFTPAHATYVEMSKIHYPAKPSYVHGDLVKYVIDITVLTAQGGTVVDIYDLSITDTLPVGLTYQPGTETSTPAAAFNQVGQVLTWSFGAGPFHLMPQAHIEFVARVDDTVPQGQPLLNVANAEYKEDPTGPVSSPSVGDLIHVAFPVLDIDKAAAPPVIHEGGAVTYTVTLSNTGGEEAVSVRVEDPIPPEVTYTAGATASSGTLDTSNPLNLVWTGSIPVGGTVTLTIPVTDKVSAGPHTLTDVAKYTSFPSNAEMIKIQDDASVQVIHPGIQLVKTCTPSGGYEPLNVVYHYTVTNTGDVPLTAVKVHDDTLGLDVSVPASLAVGESKTGTLPRNGLMEGTYVNHATAEGYDPLQLKVTSEDDATCTVGKPSVGGTVSEPTPDATPLIQQGVVAALAALGVALAARKR